VKKADGGSYQASFKTMKGKVYQISTL